MPEEVMATQRNKMKQMPVFFFIEKSHVLNANYKEEKQLTTIARKTFWRACGLTVHMILAIGSSSKWNISASTLFLNSPFTLHVDSLVEVDWSSWLCSATWTPLWTRETSSWRACNSRGCNSCNAVLCFNLFPFNFLPSHLWSNSLFW